MNSKWKISLLLSFFKCFYRIYIGIYKSFMSASACGFFVIYRYMYVDMYTINIMSNYTMKPIPKSN